MTNTAYTETLQYLYSHLPLFSKQGASAIKKDLTNTLELCRRLYNPERKFSTIHVAGTNGKGSTSHMLAAILQTAGYKTGLYTSPHLKDFRERIRINGEMIPEEMVIDFVDRIKKDIEEIEPSFFEVTVAMAFEYFAEEKVDIAVIETGLGGRLDSTNVISPLLSVITNIGFDHVNILGNTLPQIASEKAGIIKPRVPVVIGERHPETEQVFIKKAREEKAAIVFAEDIWDVEVETPENQEARGRNQDLGAESLKVESNGQKAESVKHKAENMLSLIVRRRQSEILFQSETLHTKPYTLHLQLDLTGSYQQTNVKTVLAAVVELRKQGFEISENRLINALKQVQHLTGLQGRWQTISINPLIICDTGHNEDGIKEVLKNIDLTAHQNLHIVIGMVKDKEIGKILKLLPTNASYYFCQPDLERAKPVEELAKEAAALSLSGKAYPSVPAALEAAKANARANDLIFVGGSTFVVAEII